MRRSRGPSNASSTSSSSNINANCSSSSSSTASSNNTVPSLLKELHSLVQQIQEERNRSEHNISNIAKTHEKMKSEGKVSSYFKTKLRGLYKTATSDAQAEADIIRKALEKIAIIKALRSDRTIGRSRGNRSQDSGEPPRKAMRRGVLMTMLQQAASQLPMMIGKASESKIPSEQFLSARNVLVVKRPLIFYKSLLQLLQLTKVPPPLCGALQADNNYVALPGDHVAARVKTSDGEEQWILAEIVSYNSSSNKYDVDDIDEEGKNGKERHHLSRRRVIPLPKQKANPLTHPDALFQKEQVVNALYPQTTCFYKAVIHEPPSRPQDDYLVSFEDTSYADGFAPPLHVPQRYVVAMKDNKRR